MRIHTTLTMTGALALAFLSSTASAQKVSTAQLLEMAKNHAPGLEQVLRDTLTDANIQKGAAAAGELGEFVFAVTADKQPNLVISAPRTGDAAPVAATKVGGLWVYQGKLKTGTAYRYTWLVDGRAIGGTNDLAAFGPDSYAQPGAPQGKLTGPMVLESKIYPNMKANVWYYVPAQWDGSTPLPVQIWGDGQFYTARRPDQYRVLETLDNLTAQKRIPLMANVFIQPGTGAAQNQRSIEYDTVDDTYARYLLEEVLPEIGKHVNLRQDAYSRAMVGESSGGICAFNAAFLKPDQFSRVLSWIGSFAALQVSAAHPAGGAEYPVMARRTPRKNIRVWLQDGAEDMENARAGSWPLANIELANSLKLQGYDYHFSFGVGTHNQAQGSAELPETLTWLWREYDPAKTPQDFVQDPAEKAAPLWRVTVNRQ
jgi:enterochelin esterase-like enzyme